MAVRSVDSRWSWLVCFCATFCQIVNMGILMTFAVLFPVIMKEYDSSRQATAWIGSIAASMAFFVSPLPGFLSDRFGCRVIAIIGGLICTASMVLTSFATEIVHYYFTYSLLFGLGGCLVRVPCFLVTAKYFERRRALANGIVAAGAGLGVFAFGPLTQFLLDTVGLANTYRVMAIPCLAMCAAAASFSPLEETEKICEQTIEDTDIKTSDDGAEQRCKVCSLWNIPAFTVCVLSFAFQTFGQSVPGQHLMKHCQEIGFSPDSSADLFMFIGLTSFATRIAAGHLTDVMPRLKPLHVFQLATCSIGVVTCLFGAGRSYAEFVVLSIVFGLCEGALVSMANLILLTVVEPTRRASAFGLANCVFSFSLICGPPVAGLMADQLGSYEEAFYTSGAFSIFAGCIPLALCCLEKPAAGPEEKGISLIGHRDLQPQPEGLTNPYHGQEQEQTMDEQLQLT